jgi:hypothetical protein
MTTFLDRSTPCNRVINSMLLLIYGMFLVQISLGPAKALAATPEDDFGTALQLWETANFSEAIRVLDDLVKRDEVPQDVLRDAYLLKGQCHLAGADQDTESARESFCEAVRTDSDWELNTGAIFLADTELELYAQAVEECGGGGISKLVLGGGALILGGIAYLIFGGGAETTTPPPPQPLPGFPDSP